MGAHLQRALLYFPGTQGDSRSAPWPWAMILQAFSLFSAEHTTSNIEVVTSSFVRALLDTIADKSVFEVKNSQASHRMW